MHATARTSKALYLFTVEIKNTVCVSSNSVISPLFGTYFRLLNQGLCTVCAKPLKPDLGQRDSAPAVPDPAGLARSFTALARLGR